jgi:DUF1365 family protein
MTLPQAAMTHEAMLRRETAEIHAAPRIDVPATTGQSTSPTLASAIYEGWVRHRRHAPHANAFRYRMYTLYVDLAEIDRLFSGRWLWSLNRRNIAQFNRADYFGDAATPLDTAVRDRIAQQTGVRPRGPIRLLTHLRYFGFCFNPVSFYYCFAEDGTTLETIVADISNTPWKERHAYVLPIAAAARHGGTFGWQFDKAFHVSPFLPMQCRYDWRFSAPAQNLRVHMDIYKSTIASPDSGTPELDATLVMHRRDFTGANLARVLARHPLMTLKVVAAIHWQALRIFLRGNPVFAHTPTDPRAAASTTSSRPSEPRHEP